jgi:hypothetical protein
MSIAAPYAYLRQSRDINFGQELPPERTEDGRREEAMDDAN